MSVYPFQFHLPKVLSMSTSNSFPKHTLIVKVSEGYKYLVKVVLFDSTDRIVPSVNQSINRFEYQIKKGLYTVRVEMNGEIKDRVVKVDSDQHFLVTGDRNNNSQPS